MVLLFREMGSMVLCVSFVHTGMTNFAELKVKRAHKRWQREMDHHLQPQQFADMLTQFRRSLRHGRWHHLASEMQEGIVAVATGNGQLFAL